jgi:flagellin-like hook-associated protein FlgL
MARINTNVGSLVAQTQLGRAQGSLSQALQRLSSGLRINSGADDPAGLIASESLRSEIQGVTTAIDNSQRATNIISTAEGALSEVSNLLVSMKALAVQAANTGAMSPDEIKANQLQIDSAVQSITRISNVTNFAGLNLLTTPSSARPRTSRSTSRSSSRPGRPSWSGPRQTWVQPAPPSLSGATRVWNRSPSPPRPRPASS